MKWTDRLDDYFDQKNGIKENSSKDRALDKKRGVSEDDAKKKSKKRKKKGLKLVPPSQGHKPKGARGRAAVRALGRTKTTGNFKRIEQAKGKGAAIAAYQNALRAHKAGR